MRRDVPLEIERKFLIKMPPKSFLSKGTIWRIEQTYLEPTIPGESRRVRLSESRGETVYTTTSKVRKSQLTCFEKESRISQADYYALLTEKLQCTAPVKKIRHVVAYAGHLLEIDVYPFWSDYAVMEVELDSEEETFDLPEETEVVRELTEDPRYKNLSIARFLYEHPDTPLPLE